jgi:uncharacterized protein
VALCRLLFQSPQRMGSRAKFALLCLVAVAIVTSSAFAGEGARKPVRSLLEIRQDGVVVQKWETSCAAAALATVLTFSQNDPVSEKIVAQGMLRSTDPIKVKVRGGFSLLDMKRFVETRPAAGLLSLDQLRPSQATLLECDLFATTNMSFFHAAG